ncbi:MAG: hypothetical protein IJ681_03660 [Bacteroidales bacterium]|nr:hypothetical protein [Bacteroidales bacterium]
MILKLLRKIGAGLLLAIFTTMIVFTDFHRHRIVSHVDICTFCEHNLPHPNHFSQSYSSQDICPLCHFTSESFKKEQQWNISCINEKGVSLYVNDDADRRSDFIKHFSDRAPPFNIA